MVSKQYNALATIHRDEHQLRGQQWACLWIQCNLREQLPVMDIKCLKSQGNYSCDTAVKKAICASLLSACSSVPYFDGNYIQYLLKCQCQHHGLDPSNQLCPDDSAILERTVSFSSCTVAIQQIFLPPTS